MRTWISRQYREHKWLTLAVGIYLTLSAAEATRVFLFEQPTSYDVGFYPWETTAAPSNPEVAIAFHWTGDAGAMLRPVDGTVLRLLLYSARPGLPENATSVALTIGNQPLDEVTILRDGWYSLEYYLPPILGTAEWGHVESGWVARTQAESAATEDGWFANWQELKPWHRQPSALSSWIGIAVGSTFVPSELVNTDDDRTLGIAVAEPQWLAALPAQGIGFYPWEMDQDGTEFRWTRRRASLPVEVAGSEMAFSIRSQFPGIEQQPATVNVYWDAELRHTTVLVDTQWIPVRVPLQADDNRSGTLTLAVDRSWNPAALGFSADDRELGVGVTRIGWR
jgi:hypothetical protein